MNRYLEANRSNWDSRVPIHVRNRTGFYAIDELRAGGSALGPIEAEEIGDITGKTVVHLQCHFGLDTLSLARRGAAVTGVDFSEPALETARALAVEIGLPATFVLSEVTRAAEILGRRFDVVFTTWGTIGWLPDLAPWAATVARLLEPGGMFYMADGHPYLFLLDDRPGMPRVPHYDMITPADQPIVEERDQSYTGDETPIASPLSYGWNHPLSHIVTLLIEAGIEIEFLHEHTQVPWKAFDDMVEVPGPARMFRMPDGFPSFPLAFSLRGRKAARDPRLPRTTAG